MTEILFDAVSTKTVQPRSCDQCTFRKLKCNRHKPCGRCVEKLFDCTYVKPTKRRGLSSRRLGEPLQARNSSNAVEGPLDLQSPPADADATEQTHHQDLESRGQVPIDPGLLHEDFSWIDNQDLLRGLDGFSSTFQTNQLTLNAVSKASQHTLFDWSAGLLDNPNFTGDSFYPAPERIEFSDSLIEIDARPLFSTSPILDAQLWQTSSFPEAFEWPETLDDATLLSTIDTFDKLMYSTIPVFNRVYLMQILLAKQHRKNCTYGAMLIALHAFILVQPIQAEERCLISDRMRQAAMYMGEALRMRNVGGEFGQDSSVEAVMTSFFLFGCQFGRGEHNAAWLRLREAISLGELLGLHDSSCYCGLDAEETERRIRTYWLLSVTERAYALQKRHPISFLGKVSTSINQFQLLEPEVHSRSMRHGRSVRGLHLMVQLFDNFDEGIINCWNSKCQSNGSTCKALRPQQMASLARMLRSGSCIKPRTTEQDTSLNVFSLPNTQEPSTPSLEDAQQADISITQQWLRNRLWKLCSSHHLLKVDHEYEELRYDLVVEIGCTTLAICEKTSLCSLEVHGLGMVEKIYDIALAILQLLPSPHSGESLAPESEAEIVVTAGFGSEDSNTSTLSAQFQRSHLGLGISFIHQLVNRFLAFFALFRGGLHPYLLLYMKELSRKQS